LVVPLLFAVVVAALGVRVVDRLEELRIPRPLGAIILIAAIIAIVVSAVVAVVRGILEESGEIRDLVVAGADSVREWISDGTPAPGSTGSAYDDTIGAGQQLIFGAASWWTTIFSSALAFAIGIFLSLFMLYYILVDWTRLRDWLSKHLGLPTDVGAAVIDDGTAVVRHGFAALTLTSLITSSLIGLSMLILDVPLALSVTIVTFVTSYIPYLGAILSGVFGFLVALGSGGPQDAWVLLIVILVVQNIVQTIVSNHYSSAQLKLHPLPSILSSVAGVAIAGLVGAMLSAPALALAVAVSRRVGGARVELAEHASRGDVDTSR
jgi:predicted PurR-regulated permease PerM